MGSTNRIICALGFLGFIIAILDYSLSLMKLGALAADCTGSPLSGTKRTKPFATDYGPFRGPSEIARLLYVGADICPNDSTSYVPPLDGTSPAEMWCFENYGMKFVLFDLQLINLKAFDAVAGSFTVELQMLLHWIEYLNATSNTTSKLEQKENCTFLCDTTSAQRLCCDEIWVPPLQLPGCTINTIRSVTPTPHGYWIRADSKLRRRFWYLNIDATCAAKPDFHNFPFDVQNLRIDVINPYASRTWFQLHKGFLKQNVGEGIAGIDLEPDRKTAGWEIEDLLVSSSCGTQESWQQTFLTQDYLLSILSNQTKPYKRQKDNIMDALIPKNLKCAEMKTVERPSDESLSNPADLQPYQATQKDYEERVNITLQHYRDCVESSNYIYFYLNSTGSGIKIPDLNSNEVFDLSEKNINRSFGLLDLTKEQPTKVSFQCTIAAVANLTTPGIRITILVRRFGKYYWIKLVVPTVACVAFTFSAFGLQPDELMGRLSVVVPSAIALTALQLLVVATDIPAVAYIAPTTYIMLISYAVQLFIAFESVIMSIWLKKRRNNLNYSYKRLDAANEALDRKGGDIELPSRDGGRPNSEGQQATTSINTSNGGLPASQGQQDNTSLNRTSNGQAGHPFDYWKIRICDLIIMIALLLLYISGILACTLIPLHRSRRTESTLTQQYVSMWN